MESAKQTGYWQLTIIMVVIASWILYRYVAPKGWKEWSRAGLVQAFIIALYAEMYGFPLTIYILSGYLGLDIPWLHQSGHLWATLFGWGDLGALIEMLVGYTIVFFGISLLIEGWREVYQARREGRLAADRLYGVVFLANFGQLIHRPTIPTLALFPVIVWAYVRLARKEEGQMINGSGRDSWPIASTFRHLPTPRGLAAIVGRGPFLGRGAALMEAVTRSRRRDGLPRWVRPWYGLSGEIVIEGDQWHLVKVGPLSLPHPPLVNRFIQRGLPPDARLRLSYQHELGHLQTLSLAMAYAVWLWHGRSQRPGPRVERRLRQAAALVAHEAIWELAAESYVMVKGGCRYRWVYRRNPSPWLVIFWVGMTALALLGTFLSGWKGGDTRTELRSILLWRRKLPPRCHLGASFPSGVPVRARA